MFPPSRELSSASGALLRCKATLVGISAGCASAYTQGHPLAITLRGAEAVLDALRDELDELCNAQQPVLGAESGPSAERGDARLVLRED